MDHEVFRWLCRELPSEVVFEIDKELIRMAREDWKEKIVGMIKGVRHYIYDNGSDIWWRHKKDITQAFQYRTGTYYRNICKCGDFAGLGDHNECYKY
ncbi:hypothetical protein BNJ_00229 [Kaumoebavirus]|uniref:hypothetical protein n=1 Tax=Kaumoebavirus TaxID=1859492 RepID=UPI0009C26CB8|nr:hypothetical protein BNJ_00229 [Kaumoebavirus]ARA72058.1 hypothetical protein BNJ_00229 [Kaumoebavirus]